MRLILKLTIVFAIILGIENAQAQEDRANTIILDEYGVSNLQIQHVEADRRAPGCVCVSDCPLRARAKRLAVRAPPGRGSCAVAGGAVKSEK